MYLKRVEMENFKSFGGKISVPLMEGYTGITGPNGSGKSNITDAIMFVLGPKSPKVVRAGKQTDLIYNSNKSKNKSDYMKVTLVFDNKDRMLAWDADEVRFMRHVKIAGNGEDYYSNFYINDQKSNLAEFDSLFTRARISADGYNLVQQGDVTDITKMGALERRRVIDKISGIESYDLDIAAAQKERAEAETNMQATNIVVEELKGQLSQLKKEMEVAKKHVELKEKLDLANAQLKHRCLNNEEEKVNTNNEMILKTQSEIKELENEKETSKQKIAECEKGISDTESEISKRVGPEYDELKKKIEDVKVNKALADNTIEEGNASITQCNDELEQLKEESQGNNAQLLSCKQTMDSIRIEIESKEELLKNAKKDEKDISNEMKSIGGESAELEEKLTKIDSDIDKAAAKESDANSKLARARALDEEASHQIAALETDAETNNFEIKDAEFNLSEVKKEAGPIADLSTFNKNILDLKKEESELEKEEQDFYSAIDKLTKKYNELMIEKKSSEKASGGGSEAISAVLAMRDKGEMRGIHGTIAQLASVEKGYETALSVAAGGRMQAVVVDTDEVAAKIVDQLKKNRLGRVTFLPLNKMVEGKPHAQAIIKVKQAKGYAMDFIKFKPEYSAAFWYVFQDTIVTETLSDARNLMGGVRLVTKGGELIEASGAITGGTLKPMKIQFGAASQTELDEVAEKLSSTNKLLESVKSRLLEIRTKIREADDIMRQAGSGNMEMAKKIAGLETQLKELKDKKKRFAKELEEKKAAYAKSRLEVEKLEKELKNATEGLESLRAEKTKIKNRITEIAPAEMQKRIEEVRSAIYDTQTAISSLRDSLSSATDEKLKYDNIKIRVDGDMKRINGEIEETKKRMADAEKTSKDLKVELIALRKIENEMESGIQELRDKRDKFVYAKSKAESAIEKASSGIEAKNGIILSAQAAITLSNQAIEGLKAEIALLKVEVKEPIPAEETLKHTIRNCETKIGELGNVNMRAIDDYEEKETRYNKLTDDIERLTAQIKDLDALMVDLNSKKKGLFMGVYNGVSENFNEIFAEISGGGEASMSLENEDDPFLGGLFINAKPKNGKMLRLESLSGGEKSLTALAFIFAIQEHQPSPFYVLDEVDMFLDSVNAEIVAERIKKSSAKTQFIQVSLRNVALKKADHLIGVSRPPNGISMVIMEPDLADVSKYEAENQRLVAEAKKKEGIE